MPGRYLLSPAAHAMMDAAGRRYAIDSDLQDSIAAALRAAVNDWRINTEFIDGVEYIRTTTLEKIATELEDT